MSEFKFQHEHVLEAIRRTIANGGQVWLTQSYPKPGGRSASSRKWFVTFKGAQYPAKPLGRLANSIAGHPMRGNPQPKYFARHFEACGFKVIKSLSDEAEEVNKRQKKWAEVISRPQQAKFRYDVFERFGRRCIISGCYIWESLEAAHICPVSKGGSDEDWNGIPLRVDLHRLFDANLFHINPNNWSVVFADEVAEYYSEFTNVCLSEIFDGIENIDKTYQVFAQRLAFKLKPTSLKIDNIS